MKINSEVKGSQLLTYTHYLTEFISTKIWGTEKYVLPLDRTAYTIINKLRSLLDTASYLLTNTNLDSKPHFLDGLYLILRTCLSDAICLYFIFEKYEEPVLLNDRINRLLFDHVRYVFYDATKEEKEALEKRYPEWFKEGKINKSLSPVSASTMVSEIKEPVFKKQATEALHLYRIFSKLEHNGIFTFSILHDHFDENKIEGDKMLANEAVILIIIAVNTTLSHWAETNDPALIKLMTLASDYITVNM